MNSSSLEVKNFDLGLRVKQSRKSKGLSQVEVCKKISITQPSLSAIEAGQVDELKGSTLLNLSACLGVSPQWLETGKGDMDPARTGSLISDEVALVDAFRRANSKTRRAVLLMLQTIVEK
jgi:transcriptional regulator with XRE-family HTH domain